MDEQPLPSLYHNGAQDPDNWRPAYDNTSTSASGGLCHVGDLVGWRYGAWRVIEADPVPETDLSDKTRAKLDKHVKAFKAEIRPRVFMRARPRTVVLRHEGGPFLLKPDEPFQQLHDGARTVHFRTGVDQGARWHVLTDPYRACSCHGHIWPCQEIDRSVLTAHQTRKMDKLMATTEPGVCAHCLEAITTRQKTVTFPEPSRLVPGAPGPTFHAGRAECWGAAERYERTGRLVDNPDVARLASCPGVRFIHEALGLSGPDRLDCTAGPFCTGLHGPPGYRQDPPCWHRVDLAANEGAFARPTRDCGYRSDRACLGADVSGGGTSLSPVAADLVWEMRQRRGGGGLS